MRLYNLQALRAVAAYMVFFVHLEDVERKLGGQLLLGPWANAGAWGVDLFFVLSGFVMVLVSVNKKGSSETCGRFIWSRASRIYPLWWLCLSALVVIWLVRPDLVYSGAHTNPNFLKDYLLIISHQSPLLETGWTLIHEMYFYVVFSIFLFLPIGHRARLPLLLIWGGIIIAAGLALNPQKGTLVGLALHPMTLEFILGALAAYAWKRFDGAAGLTSLLVGTLWLVMGIASSIMQPLPGTLNPETMAGDWARVAMYGPAAALIAYGVSSLESRNKLRAEGLIVSMGDWSYSLYLTHMLTLNIFGMIWAKFSTPHIYDNALGLIMILVACTVCAWISYRFFESPVLRMTKGLERKIMPKASVPTH